jgi:hypothetical protein
MQGPVARDSIVKTSAFEQHAQTLIGGLIGAAILWGANSINTLSREVSGLTGRVEGAAAVQTVESARRDVALANLAETVARHDREIATLQARQDTAERRRDGEDAAGLAVRKRPGDGGMP